MENLDKAFEEIDNSRINLKKYFYMKLEKLMKDHPITKTEMEIKELTAEFNKLLSKVRHGDYTTKNEMDKVLKRIKKIRRVLKILT